MRKYFKISVLLLLIASLLVQTRYIPTVYAKQSAKTMTILFTNDLHDNFLPIKLELNGVMTSIGGYARLQSAINAEKEQDKEALLLDAGDYSMGTPFQTIFQSDSPELQIMGQMGYDAVTFGNHEFDYRALGLAESLNVAKNSGVKLPQIVQSNITYPVDKDGNLSQTLAKLKQAMENYGVKDYTIIERNGIKVGIFGLMGEDSASKAPMSEAQFENEIDHAKRVVKILKEQEKADLIICLSHSGTWAKKSESEDEILAKKVPEINVIISGHTHTKLSQPIIVGNTIIGSSEDYGKCLGVMKVTQQAGANWELDSYELKPINDSLPEDSDITELITNFKDVVQEKYFDQFNLKFDEVVAKSPFNFQTLDAIYQQHGESTLGNLVSDAYIYAVKKAEGDNYIPISAAIVPNGTIRGTILQGDITTADAFSISSLGIGADQIPGYPLISVYLTGKELKTACEVDASIAPIMGDAQLYMAGVNFTFNPSRLIFNKVTKSTLLNTDKTTEEIDEAKLYRVVVNLYSAQMLSVVGDKSYGLMSIIPKTKDGTPIIDYEAQIIYNSEGGNKSELKEWVAVVKYLQSFEKMDGVSVVPEYYNATQGRKIVDKNNNIFALLSNPNQIAIAVYIIAAILILLIVAISIHFVKRGKRKKKNKRKKS